ncbi:MAG: hypothetical protein NVSMB5_07340 [Candidatus Velthaea sp.]
MRPTDLAYAPGLVRVNLFGDPCVYDGATALQPRVPPKCYSLLANLILHRERPVSRDALAFALWPDETADTAFANLRRYLYRVTKLLLPPSEGAPWLIVTNRAIGLNPAAQLGSDIADFERLHATDPAAAVALYSGDLLAGAEDEWLVPYRERLRDRYVGALIACAGAAQCAGDIAAALEYIRQLAEADPLNEDALCASMKLRERMGDRVGALVAYRTFVDRLRAEIGVEPSAAATALFQRISTTHSAANGHGLPLPTLPAASTALFGRERELADVHALLATHRLVTLTGAGGIGKTRIAIETARTLAATFRDGVRFVDLARIASPQYVLTEIASTLEMPATATDLLGSICDRLRDRRLLLILDNCEHVTAEVAAFVRAVVTTAEHLAILVTSRTVLNLTGEASYRVPSLELQTAVSLFEDRAKHATAAFTMTESNARAVAEICSRLDGIALAIELAAARTNVIDVHELLKRLDHRFRLLTTGDRARPRRHQTLRALIDWSYDLLEPAHAALFRRLAIFQGGWELEAAVAVVADAGADEFTVLDALGSLIDTSLIVVDFTNESQRYRMLDSLRAYGLERLNDCGEIAEFSARHAVYVESFTQNMDAIWDNAPELEWRECISRDLENIRAALDWTLTKRHDPQLGARIAAHMTSYWSRIPLEGMRWLQLALRLLPAQAPAALRGELALALALNSTSNTIERREAEAAAVALLREIGDLRLLARALYSHGSTLAAMGAFDEAEKRLNEALEIETTRLNARGMASVLTGIGFLAATRGDTQAAVNAYAQALDFHSGASFDTPKARLLMNMGELAFKTGEPREAMRLAREALGVFVAIKSPTNSAIVCLNLAAYADAAGDAEAARTHAFAAFAYVQESADRTLAASILEQIAIFALADGDPERAARLVGFSDAAMKRAGYQRYETETAQFERIVEQLHMALPAANIERLRAEGARLSEREAIEVARGLASGGGRPI